MTLLYSVKVGLPLSREINNSMKRQGDGKYWAANPYDLLPLCGACHLPVGATPESVARTSH